MIDDADEGTFQDAVLERLQATGGIYVYTHMIHLVSQGTVSWDTMHCCDQTLDTTGTEVCLMDCIIMIITISIICVIINKHICIHLSLSLYIYVYVCMYVCVYMYIYIYTYYLYIYVYMYVLGISACSVHTHPVAYSHEAE